MDELAKDLFSADLNLQILDGKPCVKCGEVPPTRFVTRTADGKFLKRSQYYTDRSSRIDCDAAYRNQQSKLMTYHKQCWIEACMNYVRT